MQEVIVIVWCKNVGIGSSEFHVQIRGKLTKQNGGCAVEQTAAEWRMNTLPPP